MGESGCIICGNKETSLVHSFAAEPFKGGSDEDDGPICKKCLWAGIIYAAKMAKE